MHIKFVAIPVHDQDRALKFYQENLDCSVFADRPYSSDGWRWIEMQLGTSSTTIHFERRDIDEPIRVPVLVIVDPDLDGRVAKMKANSVTIVTELRDAPWEAGKRFAEFRDSEGNRIMIASK